MYDGWNEGRERERKSKKDKKLNLSLNSRDNKIKDAMFG